MRTWTKSACVVLAWSILLVILVAVGMKGPVHPAQANTRTAGSTEVILTSTLSVAAAPVTATSPTTRYVVQPGDTLSGIAARFAIRGGWPAHTRPTGLRSVPIRTSSTPAPCSCCPAGWCPSATPSRPVTLCRASPPGSPCAAAGRPCTRPTGMRSVPIRTSSTPGPFSRSHARRHRPRPRRAGPSGGSTRRHHHRLRRHRRRPSRQVSSTIAYRRPKECRLPSACRGG